MRDSFDVEMSEREWKAALSEIQRKSKAVNSPWMKSTHRRNLRPIANAMRMNSKSARISKMVGITTAVRRTGDFGAKVGVVKNDPSDFPTFSAPALASVIEYGTEERFRGRRSGGFVTGAISTGEIQPAPFLRPAWDTNVRGFMDTTEKDILDKIETEGA